MPVLTNNRRELFAQLLFQGFTAVDAYAKAGFKRHSGNACTLGKNPEVLARLEEIRAEAEAALVPVGTAAIAARANVSVESLLDQAETILARALDSGQLSAAVSALKEKGVLSGKRVERSEIGAPGEFDSITDDELERVVVERFVRLGLASKLALIDGSVALNGGALASPSDDD